ncbi:MAG TPA: hypothetical protein VGQ39_06015 [Pyrinomonadaceae bacterium]|jgi:hypothetical protein|nr:hypothetical protein [Pyrinomonadaceae bacterium]
MQSVLYAAVGVALLLTPHYMEIGINHTSQKQNPFNQSRSPFRYVIVRNDVRDIAGDPKDAHRFIEILLDEKSFSEQTLKELFKLVSVRFPKPNRLDVWVYTSLEQVKTPEESEIGNLSESNDLPALDKHGKALLVRSEGDEWLRYSTNPPNTDMKTVILKGRGP